MTNTVTLETNLGTIKILLDAEKAPKTVSNFLSYIESNQYDGTIFHRVIDGFMIQGGGMDKDMKEKKTNAPISNEANNGLSNSTGTIAMARTNDPHSATAQFFINVANNTFLDFDKQPLQSKHPVFGKVTAGKEVVLEISKVNTIQGVDRPVEEVLIEKVEIIQ